MADGLQVAGGVLGFLSALAQASEAARARRRQENIALLQLLGQQPGRTIDVAQPGTVEPTSALARFRGAGPLTSTTGAPVVMIGDTPVTVGSVPSVAEQGGLQAVLQQAGILPPSTAVSPASVPATPTPQPAIGVVTNAEILADPMMQALAAQPAGPDRRLRMAQRKQEMIDEKERQSAQQEVRQQRREAAQQRQQRIDFGFGDTIDAQIFAMFGNKLRGPSGVVQQPTPQMVDQAIAAIGKRRLTRAEREGVEAAKQKNEIQKQQQRRVNLVTENIRRVFAKMRTASLPTTGPVGAILSRISGTTAADIRFLLDTVRANIGFQALQEMRNASKTGGALGQVSEREIAFLQATMGNLEQAQTREQFTFELTRLHNQVLDTIHGSGQGPARLPVPTEPGAPGQSETQGATQDTPEQAELRRRLKALGRTDEEINTAIGRQ